MRFWSPRGVTSAKWPVQGARFGVGAFTNDGESPPAHGNRGMLTGVSSGGDSREGSMSDRNVEWIIANAINEQARDDPDALAADIIAALEKAGYRITPGTDDTALGSQPFDELTPDMRP